MDQERIIAELAALPLIVRGSPDEVFKTIRRLQEAARKQAIEAAANTEEGGGDG